MAGPSDREYLAFRCIVAALALIPISAGASGGVLGLSFPGFELNAGLMSSSFFVSYMVAALSGARQVPTRESLERRGSFLDECHTAR